MMLHHEFHYLDIPFFFIWELFFLYELVTLYVIDFLIQLRFFGSF